MSSRRTAACKRRGLEAWSPGTRERVASPTNAPKTRGPRQPRAGDFQVTIEMPLTLPILDKELRAIEVMLNKELLNLLGCNAKDC